MWTPKKYLTVGINPCWDIICRLDGLEWGQHKPIEDQCIRPAGKALNVSHALAWMGLTNHAAGLWGQTDYPLLRREIDAFPRRIKPQFTVVPGRTRQNITVCDTRNQREFHLRAPGDLASPQTLKKLYADLRKRIAKNSICILAGALGAEESLPEIQRIISLCREKKAHVVLDTSGPALKALLREGGLWLIKPNVLELGHILGHPVPDRPDTLVPAAASLLNRADMVLVSRGEKGAILLTSEQVWTAQLKGKGQPVVTTVGCGDYSLAGFLKGWHSKNSPAAALQSAVKAGTARAWGWSEQVTWSRAERKIKVICDEVQST